MLEPKEVNDVHSMALKNFKFGGTPLISSRRLQ